MNRLLPLFVLGALVSGACGEGPVPADLKPLAAALPADADVVAVVDLRGLVSQLTGLGLAGLDDDGSLERDLNEQLDRLLGAKLASTRGALAFVTLKDKAFGAALEGDLGDAALKGEKVDVEGTPAVAIEGELFMARVGSRLVLGTPPGIAALAAVAKGGKPALEGSEAWQQHLKALKATGVGTAALAVSAAWERIAPLMGDLGPMAVEGIEHVAFAAGSKGSIGAVVRGQDGAIAQLRKQLDAGLAIASVQAAKMASQARESDDLMQALSGVASANELRRSMEKLQIESGGGTLSIRLDGSLQQPVFLIGLLAAVAVPSFIKYERRAKTTEAIENLERIYGGAVDYFSTPRVGPDGTMLPCAFPPSAPITPTAGTCCGSLGGPDADGDDRCDPDPDAWSAPTWKALGFAPAGPHRFVYAFESSGTGADATFTATAYGDLDCDGVRSTFQRVGRADPEAGAGACGVQGSPGLHIENDSE